MIFMGLLPKLIMIGFLYAFIEQDLLPAKPFCWRVFTLVRGKPATVWKWPVCHWIWHLCVSFFSLAGKIERMATGGKHGTTCTDRWQIKIQDCFPLMQNTEVLAD